MADRIKDVINTGGVLTAHKVPKSVRFVDALPKNASRKLLKRELRTQLTGSAAGVPAADRLPGPQRAL